MSNQKETRGFSRRSFLTAFGLLSGAAVAPLGLGTIGSASARNLLGLGSSSSGAVKIGLIVKRGSWTTDSMLSGIGLYLNEINEQVGNRKVQLVIEEMSGTSSLLRSTKKLVEKDGVAMVIAHANSRAAASVKDYVESNSVIFIEMNAGEVMPNDHSMPKTYFRSTLNLWQANAAMGAWAANTIGKTAAIQTSFSNSGFDFHTAFEAGFTGNGGEIVSRIVTGAPSNTDHPMRALSEVRELNPAVVYGSYSDQAATVYQHALRSSGLNVTVLGTDHSHGRDAAAGSVAGIAKHATSWSAELPNAENKAFIESYTSFTGKQPDVFAVLGYDTARFALGAAEKAGRNGSLRAALLETAFASPRGECVCDSSTQTLSTPLYLCGSDTAIVTLDPSHVEPARASFSMNELRGGWLNSYLVG